MKLIQRKSCNTLCQVVDSSFTSDFELFAETAFGLVFNRDLTFIISRVGGPGRVESVHDCVFFGDSGEDGSVVPFELESVRQVREVIAADADPAVDAHWCPALNCVAGSDCEADAIYNVRCRFHTDTQTCYREIS